MDVRGPPANTACLLTGRRFKSGAPVGVAWRHIARPATTQAKGPAPMPASGRCDWPRQLAAHAFHPHESYNATRASRSVVLTRWSADGLSVIRYLGVLSGCRESECGWIN